ncbi:hypothetical protein ATANTOWER_002615 [Ataeniobius toweri]|uniref:Uncharacterized protein n=1 Tax=Ataeniobius toweri TaxID=208326 RepID=A0ABU7C5U4_9TELE|nr:hypothetical protein [Ataeniobius toweri]
MLWLQTDPHAQKNNTSVIKHNSKHREIGVVVYVHNRSHLLSAGAVWEMNKRRVKLSVLGRSDCQFSTTNCLDVETQPVMVGQDVNNFTETEFIQNFIMSRATFNHICQRLSS